MHPAYVQALQRKRTNHMIGGVLLLLLGFGGIGFALLLYQGLAELRSNPEIRLRLALQGQSFDEQMGDLWTAILVSGLVGMALFTIGILLLARMPARLVPMFPAPMLPPGP